MNRRLLFLDDEEDFLEIYRAILSLPQPIATAVGSGGASARPIAGNDLFAITTVSSGEEALKVIQEAVKRGEPFAGGFFDVHLRGGIDGIETIRRAKELDSELLWVVVTGEIDRSIDEMHRIFGAGFSDRWDFLSKPFTEAEILQKSHNLVSQWERRRRESEYAREIREQQERLLQAERLAAVGTLARGIGNEFGNILHTIMSQAETALKEGSSSQMSNALKQILSFSERAGHIVRNLQSLVRMEAERSRVEVGELVHDCLGLIDYEIKKHHLKLKADVDRPGGLPSVLVNRTEMTQAIANILINGIQAMQDNGGELKVAVTVDESTVQISIEDQGGGIPEENLERIFDPLFTTKLGTGTGIGLTVSRRIVRNHGGKIMVASQIGQGAKFVVHLPLN